MRRNTLLLVITSQTLLSLTLTQLNQIIIQVYAMSDKETAENNKTTSDISKKSPVKKSARKKTSIKKTAARTTDSEIITVLQSFSNEINKDRESRDQQMISIISEFRSAFTTLNKQNNTQGKNRETEISGLYQSLQETISAIHESNEQREEKHLRRFKSLSDSIVKDHEQTLMEVHEQEKVQDKKLQYIDKVQLQRTSRNRLIAVPAVILAIIAITYMVKVVNIMETAMTSMSQDIGKIQISVGDMSTTIETISLNTTSMNTNMASLDGNTQQMSKDLNIMTHNVAPAMQGMRDMMPWTR